MSPHTLAEQLGLSFRDPALLARAFVHRTFTEEAGGANNERLEYLGDAVLELAMTELLYKALPDADEGQLSRVRNDFVSRPRLAAQARAWNLGQALKLGRGEENSGGREKDRLLADVFEALLGALYLDQGYPACLALVARAFDPLIADVDDPSHHIHPKSRLQELSIQRWKTKPTYDVVDASGPDHKRAFTIEVRVGDRVTAQGTAGRKKDAETAAAIAALALLEDE